MTASNLDTMRPWLAVQSHRELIDIITGSKLSVLMKDCHSQAVLGSRAMAASDWRRNSPWRGDSSSPTLEPLPGKSVPSSKVSTKNWGSKVPGVESKGVP